MRGQYLGAGRGWRRKTTRCKRGHVYTGAVVTRRRRRGGLLRVDRVRICTACYPLPKHPGMGSGHRRLTTHCPRGHEYAGSNLGVQVVRTNSREIETRMCMACRRANWNRYATKKRAERRAAL